MANGRTDVHEAAAQILRCQAPPGMKSRVVAIDGLGGSGKSTFAGALRVALRDPPVIETDDFASWEDPLGWWPRLLDQVLRPLGRGAAATYQRYDWETRTLAEWRTVEPTDLLIIEGVSSSRAAFRPYIAYSIWIEASRATRLQRGLERDGEGMRDHWIAWMQQEDEYVRAEQPQERADLVLSGSVDASDL